MKMQFGVEDERNLAPALEAEDALASWWADLTAHGVLKAELEAATRRQTELMEMIRVFRRDQPCRAPRSSIARALSSQGLTAKAEDAQVEAEVPVPAAKLELEELDRQVDGLRHDLRSLETTILTRDPQTVAETGAILRLLSGMLTAGVRIDEDYLADILETAAEPCGGTLELSAQSAH